MTQTLSAHQIFSLSEVTTILADLHRRSRRSFNARVSKALFRLACGAGLRRKELVGLNVSDLSLEGDRPTLTIRPEITKGREGKRRRRVVPLWWDKGTLEDLRSWMEVRLDMGAGKDDPFLVGSRTKKRMTLRLADKKWRCEIRRILGETRADQVTLHGGRHTFCSHAIAAGRPLVAVRDAAGHSSIAMTDRYTHMVDDETARDMFEVPSEPT